MASTEIINLVIDEDMPPFSRQGIKQIELYGRRLDPIKGASTALNIVLRKI